MLSVACPHYSEGQERHHSHQGPVGFTDTGQDGNISSDMHTAVWIKGHLLT